MKFLYSAVVLLSLCWSTHIFAQKIEVKSGFWRVSYYQNEKQLQKDRFLKILRTDAEAYSFWKTGTTFETLTYPTLILGAGFTAWNIANNSNNESNALPAVGGIVTGIAGIIFLSKMLHSKRKAVQTYNKNIENKTAVHILPSLKGFGIRLVLN